MKKHIQSWLVTFAVIFASSMGFHACSDDAVSIFRSLGELTSQLGEGDLSNLADYAGNTCTIEGSCDGVIPELYSASANPLATEGDSISVNVSVGGSHMVTGTRTSTVAETDLLALLAADGETTAEFTVQAGSIELIPLNQLVVPVVSFTTGGEGSWASTSDAVRDVQALTDAITSLFGSAYTQQELVNQAVTDDVIDDASTETREVALSAFQMDDCDTGTARLDQAVVVEIDGDEIVTDEFYNMETVTFINCVIAGDWLGDGMPNETVTFNGSITSIDLVTDTEDRSTVAGTVLVDAQDSMSMPFWVDRLNINTREVWDNTAGPGPDEISGGICYGGNVQPDNDNTTDTGDTCTGDGTFVSATDFSIYAD